MSDSPLPVPARLLKRAGELANSHGQVVKELADDECTPPSRKTNGFGAAIKRTFRDLKNRSSAFGRSQSLAGHTTTIGDAADDDQQRRRGHSKSLSDVSAILPIATQTPPLSAPAVRLKRFSSAQHRPPPLSSLSEGLTADHISPLPEPSSPAIGNIRVPQLLQQGTPMTKVSAKKHKKFVFRLDADLGQIVWESKKHKIIPIENIKEIRSGEDARHSREQFQLSKDYENRWLTIIYILDGNYKTLHLIAATRDVFLMWDQTLRRLHAVRQELMQGLGNGEIRQALWEKQYWKGADEERDQKLTFDEVEKLCRRLNINSNHEDLLRLFKQADVQEHQYLDFNDFRRFVKLLKARPEIDRLYKRLRNGNAGIFDFGVFEKFMRDKQQSTLSQDELLVIFTKHAGADVSADSTTGDHLSNVPTTSEMTLDAFTAFLLSPDNSVFADQSREIWHDMTRPISEYFISSSHNTYLVGHQLVGDSTIEGYIRALLHSCRSVELDIYDGEQEPMIFHGKTFTSKVSLRQVCHAIAKYGFVASPYPIIISAEVHCSLPQQDMIAEIMLEEFKDSLVRVPPDGMAKIETLPSPEDLKGKILLKAKNLQLLRTDASDADSGYYTDPSSSASDSDAFFEMMKNVPDDAVKKLRRQSDSTVKGQLSKAGTNLLQRVRSVGRGGPTPTPELVLSPPPSFVSSPVPITPLHGQATPVSPSPPTASYKSPTIAHRLSDPATEASRPKPKMSMALIALLVYTVGVKCRGINKKEEYAPEHVFSLSENIANKMLRFNMWDLVKHTKTHVVRTYPKGLRLNSTNYEPHRFWAAGAQLVAINWQTFDLGYMINHAMFQRNGRSGYVLKPPAIRLAQKDLLAKRTMLSFNVTVISAQQLPRPKDASGHEVADKAILDPYVEVTLYIPDWPIVSEARHKEKGKEKEKAKAKDTPDLSVNPDDHPAHSRPSTPTPPLPSALGIASTPSRTVSSRTSVVRKNGFNPVWEEKLSIPFDCVGDMMDLIFVRFVVRQEDKDTEEPLAVYCASLGSLQLGYRHLPLHDSQLSQYLFSTLFVRINITTLTP